MYTFILKIYCILGHKGVCGHNLNFGIQIVLKKTFKLIFHKSIGTYYVEYKFLFLSY